MVKEKNNLKQRTQTVTTRNALLSSGEEESSEEEGSEVEEGDARGKAVSQIEKELMEAEASEGASESESEEEDVIKVSFKKKGPAKAKKEGDKGIMGLKFMKRAEERQKEQLKDQAKSLIQQIKDDQAILNSEEDEIKPSFVKTATSKFSKTALPVPEAPKEETIKKAA